MTYPRRRIQSTLAGVLLSTVLWVWVISCTPTTEIVSDDPNLNLLVSRDTVLFDTLFTTVGSTTRRLKLLNLNSSAVEIDRIGLARGEESPFRLWVNGERGSAFTGEVLRGGDSLLMLVEVTIDPQDENLPFLERDSIQVQWNGQEQYVKLLAWGQDANFLGNVELRGTHTWTAERPYVLYDVVVVDSAATLTVEPGTKIYANVGTILGIEGTLNVQGDSGRRVLFQHSRLEEDFDNAAGQWGGIYFLPGSTGNVIEYADIRNSEYGVYVGTPDQDTIPDVILGHTLIENTTRAALIAFTSDVYAYNCQFQESFEFLVANLAGGSYRYDHCTIANINVPQREFPAAVFSDNVVLANNELLTDRLWVEMRNCIVWGSEEEEVLLDNGGMAAFSVTAYNTLVKGPEGIITGDNLLFNTDPVFVDESENDLHLDSLSPARDRGLGLKVTDDLEGKLRDAAPDMGAYEYQQ